jgi:hypothetical protein
MAKAKVEEQSRPKVRSLYEVLEGWDEFPPAWKPVPGEVLVGTVEAYDIATGKYGETKVCVLKDQAEGSLIAVYLSSTVLLGEFTKLRPKIGERVGIRYLGKAEGENAYHRYKVVVDREMNVDEFFGAAPSPAAVPVELAGVDDVPL